MEENTKHTQTGLIAGRNAVLEALKNSRPVDSIYIQAGTPRGSLGKIFALAKEQGVPVKDASAQKLESMCPQGNHQGVVAVAAAYQFSEMDDIFAHAGEKPPFIIIADEIEDPHNLGAILRTAEAAGADGIIIPKRHGVGLTQTVAKTSAGAVEYVPVVRVPNLVAALKELKERGVWIYGADMNGETWCGVDFTGPVGLVIGSEGKGISRLTRENCDFIVSLPMCGKINSLNASVAAGILMYEVSRQRLGLKAKE